MYERIAKDLGFTFKDEPRFVEQQHLPTMFLAYIIHSGNGLTTMAMGINNLTHIIIVKDFPQSVYIKSIIDKPLIFRRFYSGDTNTYNFISADVSKVWTPENGNMICVSHPKHGLTKKFAPIGKVYNERFCLLPITKDYK